MTDLPVMLLVAAALSFLLVSLTSALVAEHTSVDLHPALRDTIYSRARCNLIIEIPVIAFLLGGGEILMVLALIDQDSTLPVRLVAAVQVVAAAG